MFGKYLIAPALFAAGLASHAQINPNQIARGNTFTGSLAANAITYCNGRIACEWHITGQSPINSTLSLPPGMNLVFEGGGQIAIASGAVLTVNGTITAPRGLQIFTGAGTVANLTSVDPAWFGGTYTLDQLVSTLQDVPHATILPWNGVVKTTGGNIARGHLRIQGFGMLPYSADHTQFVGPGSIIQGKINFNIADLQMDGVNSDMGLAQSQNGGYCTGDQSGNLLDIAGAGGTLSSISISNVATLGCNSQTSAHSILIENFDGVRFEHLRTWFNTRGLVSKSSNVYGNDIESHECAYECFIIKSDATEGGIALENNEFHDVRLINAVPNTTSQAQIYAAYAPLSNTYVDGLTMINAGELLVYGYGSGSSLTGTTLVNFHSEGSNQFGLYIGAYNNGTSVVSPWISNPASSGIWFVGSVNIVAPMLINPGNGQGITETNGGSGTVTGGQCIGATSACVNSQNGPLYVSNMNTNGGPASTGGGVKIIGSPYTANGNLMVGTTTDLTNYYFGNSDVRQDKSIGVSGFNTAQFNMQNTGTAQANQHNFQALVQESSFSMSFLDDNLANGKMFFACTRSGTTATGCNISAPLTVPSIIPANGFSGSCTTGNPVKVLNGIITSC